MKKIRIETKSGELVKEIIGKKTPYIVVDGILMPIEGLICLGLIVKEIEVEEKKPVVRWLWAILENDDWVQPALFKKGILEINLGTGDVIIKSYNEELINTVPLLLA